MKIRLQFPLLCLFLFVQVVQAQFNWEHTDGPAGTSNSILKSNDFFVFHPESYGLFRTSDGEHWKKLSRYDLFNLSGFGSTIAGIESPSWSQGLMQSHRLYISHDNGDTWVERLLPSGLSYYGRMVICSHGIYIPDGTQRLLFRSQDDGVTWTAIDPGFAKGFHIFTSEDNLFMDGTGGLYRSDNQGQDWTLILSKNSSIDQTSDIWTSGSQMVVGSHYNTWHSSDGGANWQSIPMASNRYYRSFALSNGILYASGGPADFARSDDFGATWTNLELSGNYPTKDIAVVQNKLLVTAFQPGIYQLDVSTLKLIPAFEGIGFGYIEELKAACGKVWVSTDKVIYRYDEGTYSWDSILVKPITQLADRTFDATENGMVAFIDFYPAKVWISRDTGQTWNKVPFPGNPPDGQVAYLKIVDSIIFANRAGYGYHRSGDFGQNWTPVPEYIGPVFKFRDWFVTGSGEKILGSLDQGQTWPIISTLPGRTIYSMFTAGDRLFVEAKEPAPNAYTFSIYSSPDGVNWFYSNAGLPTDMRFYYDYDSGKNSDFFYKNGRYYAYNWEFGFFGSTDTCQTWVPLEQRPFSEVTMEGDLYCESYQGGMLRSEAPEFYDTPVSGRVYLDDNNNGQQDAGESFLANIKIKQQSPRSWWPYFIHTTDPAGAYSFQINSGQTDTIKPLIISTHVETIHPPYYLSENGGTDKDFGIYLTPNVSDFGISGAFVRRLRPGFTSTVHLGILNQASIVQDATVSLKIPPEMQFVTSNTAPDAIIGDSIVWTLSSVNPLEGRTLNLEVMLADTVQLGTLMKGKCYVVPSIPDVISQDNTVTFTRIVVNSLDPNDKQVSPEAGITEEELAAGKELFYTVNFQNTGTAEAERVRITDMLDADLDWNTLRLVDASHTVTSFRMLPTGLLEVIFDHIMLPDSNANEPASHGYVTYAIQCKKSFAQPQAIHNQALIYFDFNLPIFTNIVETKLIPPAVSGLNSEPGVDLSLKITPNPSAGSFEVAPMTGQHGAGWLVMYDGNGRECLRRDISDVGQPVFVEVKNLPAGIYQICVSNNQSMATGKLILQPTGSH